MTDTATITHPRRVTIVAPDTRIDLALPVQATVGEVVQQIGSLLGDRGPGNSANAAWTLGRIGETPLDPAWSILTAEIRDGDVLQLRDHESASSAAIFDDVVDAVAEASRTGSDRWTPDSTRIASLVACALVLFGGAIALATLDDAAPVAAAVAVASAVSLLIAAAAMSRALADATAGLALAVPAMGYAAVAAALPSTGASSASLLGAEPLAVGGAAVVTTAALGGLAVGRFRAPFVAVAAVATTGSVAAITQLLFGVRPASIAAVVAALAMGLMAWLPYVSVRLARLPLPIIPADMAEFRQDERPTSGEAMMSGARDGGRVLTWMLLSLTSVVAACGVVLLRDGGRWQSLLLWALSAALVLRARRLPGLWQRLALIVPGALGATVLVITTLAGAAPVWRLVAGAATLVVAGALVMLARSSRRRGATPYAARLVDIVEFCVLASLLPLAVAVLGLYSRLRGAGG